MSAEVKARHLTRCKAYFTQATTDAHAFRQTSQSLPKNHTLSLDAYAVACVHQLHG